MDWDIVFQAAIVIVSILGLGIVNSMAKEWINARVNQDVLRIVEQMVVAAEQMFDDNDQKLDYVMKLAAEKYPNLDVQYLRMMVEASVRQLHSWGWGDTEKSTDDASDVE